MICTYCDCAPDATGVDDRGWCRNCRSAFRLGGGKNDAERMRELLERLVQATQAGLRADDLEVALIAQEAEEMLS